MYISGGLCFQERGLRDNTEQEGVRQWGGSVVLHPKQITLFYWQHTFIG